MNQQPSETTRGPFAATAAAVARVAAIAGPYLVQLLDKAQPTPAMLRALADELHKGAANPRSVSHPELLDPDVYWQQAVWPQASAAVRHARAVLAEASEELRPSVLAAERDLGTWLEQYVADEGAAHAADPTAAREAAIDAIAERCEQLHNTVAAIAVLRPATDGVERLRADLDANRRRQAEADVRKRRPEALLPDLDPDDARAVLAADADAVVARRDAELRGELPWRHQELAVFAHEQARYTLAADVDLMVERLTDPILEMGQRLVVRYDELTGAVFAPAPEPDVTPEPEPEPEASAEPEVEAQTHAEPEPEPRRETEPPFAPLLAPPTGEPVTTRGLPFAGRTGDAGSPASEAWFDMGELFALFETDAEADQPS